MKTESEARKCWCPFARVNVPVSFPIGGNVSQTIGTAAVNRFVRNEEGAAMAACIASECMAWRWAWSPERGASFSKDTPPDGRNWRYLGERGPEYGPDNHYWEIADKEGRCGLAGEP